MTAGLIWAASGCSGTTKIRPGEPATVSVDEPGTGEPNTEPLWPLRVGAQFRFDAATWFIGRDFDLDGAQIFVLQSAVRTQGVLPDTLGAVPASWVNSRPGYVKQNKA